MSMNDRIGGVLRLVGAAVEGNGGVQTLTVRPADENEVWILRWLRCWHTDDGGNRLIEWYVDDNVVASSYKWRTGATAAANAEHMFYGADVMEPITLEYGGMNVIVQSTGVLAGHYLNWTGLVEVFTAPHAKVRMLPA